MASYDLEGARSAGLSDGEIASALAARTNYDLEGAKKAGVPEADIVKALVSKYNQGFPEASAQPPGLRPGTGMRDRAASIAKDAQNTVMMRDPGVDYETGVKNFALRAGLSRMSTDAERTNYLDQSVGAGNHGRDKYGRYYIHPEGLQRLGIQSDKPLAINESGGSRYDVADYAGDVPAVAGAMGGALAATGLGAPAGMLATGAGAVIGKAVDELAKRGQGLNLSGPQEQTQRLLSEGAQAAAGEGVARGVIGLGRFAMNPYGRYANPERQALTRDALESGMLPKVFQFQPDAKLLARFQSMGENVMGDRAAAQNTTAITRGMNALEDRAGNANPPQALLDRVGDYTQRLRMEGAQARERATQALDQSVLNIQRTLGSADPNVGATVQQQIKAGRQKFGQDASVLYAKVDELAGGQPIVPTSAVKQQLTDLMANLPTDKAGEKIFPTQELKQFFAKYGDIADMQTTQQMQQLRTDFRQAAESLNLVPGVDKRRASMLKNSVDRAFDDAMQSTELNLRITSPILDKDGNAIVSRVIANKPGNPEAITALREADEFYKQGIKKFDSPAIAALTRDASQGGAVEPMRVVDTVIKPGYSAAAMRVKSLLPPETWAKVQRAHFDSMIGDSIHVIDGQYQISGQTLFRKIQDMGMTFNTVYGPEAGAIRKYAAELSARDGKIDPSLLTGDTANNLRVAVAKQRDLDAFLSTNYLASLGKPGQEATQAADFIFKPNSPARIAEAKRFYGEGSREFEGLKNNAMNKLLGDMVQPGQDPLKKIFDGKALQATLDKYGKPTLIETFGRETTDALFQFAKTTQLVTQTNKNSGGIVAAAVALHPLNNIGKILDIALTTRLLRSPGAIKWLSEGVDSGNAGTAAGALTRLGALSTAIAKDKTSSAPIDLNAPNWQR